MTDQEFSLDRFEASLRPIVDERREQIISHSIDSNRPGSITLDYADFEAKRQIREELRVLAGVALEGALDA